MRNFVWFSGDLYNPDIGCQHVSLHFFNGHVWMVAVSVSVSGSFNTSKLTHKKLTHWMFG
jgi:hypothetical protein